METNFIQEPCVEEHCPVARALDVLDGKWTILVVRDLLSGTKRFTELRRSLAGVSSKTLTDRLRSLEAHGILERRMYPEIPPRVEYSLTERGRTLAPVFDALAAWGALIDEATHHGAPAKRAGLRAAGDRAPTSSEAAMGAPAR